MAAGKGFRMQTFNERSTKVAVIRKHYAKGGSTDPYVEHPTKPGFLRKFTPTEHARIKGYKKDLISGMSAVKVHQVLGQGVSAQQVKALFRHIGISLVRSCQVISGGGVSVKGSGSSYALKGTG